MHVHFGLRIHRWVIWWFCLGLVVGVVALVNILFRDFPRTQEKSSFFLACCTGSSEASSVTASAPFKSRSIRNSSKIVR